MSDARLHIRQSPNLGRKTEFWVEAGDVWVEISNLFTGFDYTVEVNDLPQLRLDVYPMAVTFHPPEWQGGPPAPLVTLPDEPLSPPPRTGPPKQAPDVIREDTVDRQTEAARLSDEDDIAGLVDLRLEDDL